MRFKRKAPNISFDEAIANSNANDTRSIERPINNKVFALVLVGTILVSFVILLRISFLGIVNADIYSQMASANINKETYINAPRGIIFDRYNNPLVNNKRVFSVFLNITELARHEELDDVIKKTSSILDIDDTELSDYISQSSRNNAQNIKIAEDITREQVIEIKDLNLNSLSVEEDYKRQHINEALSHVVGYVGQPTREDIKSDKGIKLIDSVGKTGLEAYYDKVLRGTHGKKIDIRNAILETKEVKLIRDPQIGATINTTIDLELQEHFYDTLKTQMDRNNQKGGVGIAINPQNGEVLSLISLPGFESSNISKYLIDENLPLFNRAVSGVYNPGSTIKPVHAVAALKEEIVNTRTSILSRGRIEIPNPYNPNLPSRFVDWRPHGWVDVYSSLAKSSNIYFYAISGGLPENEMDIINGKYSDRGLGINRFIEYWKKFGLGTKTGIDIPGERSGFLPSPEEKEKRTNIPWRVGDTYNISIGQGDLLLTPLQLINTASVIATGGEAFRLRINMELQTEKILDVSDLSNELKEIQKGMEDAVYKEYGTANMLSGLPFRTAAKTGTAQVSSNRKTNALFIGYGPIIEDELPSIAILILIEDSEEGSANTLPIANDVFKWYYDNRLTK